MPARLTHLDARGRARMVDVGEKPISARECVARGRVTMAAATLKRIVEGSIPKGDVFATARIAGIQAAKRACDWVPLAHPLPLDAVELELRPDRRARAVEIEARVRAHWRTGVEMEALAAVVAAGLTLYDMCKAVDRSMTIESVRLVRKSGGKSGEWRRAGEVEPPAVAGTPSLGSRRPPNRRRPAGVRGS